MTQFVHMHESEYNSVLLTSCYAPPPSFHGNQESERS